MRSARARGAVLLLAFALASGACRPGGGGAGAPAPAGPDLVGADVLLVTIDTLRADAVGFLGNRRGTTPNLDRLAARALVFDDAHAHNVVTLPSHTNILTGEYPFAHGVRDNTGFYLPASVPTLADRLRLAGYATAAFVGAYPLDAGFGLAHGFDVYDDRFPRGANPEAFEMPRRSGDQVVAPALAWWQAHRGSRRFLWVHLYDPHAPYEPPQPFAARFADAPYLGAVAAADSFVAPLLAPLLEGKEPPAMVVVTADHGEALGDHGELTHGLFAYESTLRVPLLVWGPGIAPGRDRRAARHIDIVPTILQALRLPLPPGLPGASLLGPPPRDDSSYFEALSTCLNRGWAPLRGMIRRRHKVMDLPLPELYDLARDARETDNRVTVERPLFHELQAALPHESTWPPPRGAVTAEQQAQLRSLGYASGEARPKASYAAADDPKNLVGLDHQLHQMMSLYATGRFEDTVRLGRAVLARRPDTTEALERVALALRHLERGSEAIALLQQALEHHPDREALRRQLGMTLSEAGRAADAVTVLQPIAGSHETETLNALGAALSEAGEPQAAEETLRRAIGLHPSDPRAHENLGIALLRVDRVADANAELDRALAMEPRLPISWNTLGVARYRLHDIGGAIAAWQRAAALDPTRYDALFNLGLVAAEAGRPQEARQALGRFVETAPPVRYGADIAKARAMLARMAS